MNQDDLDLLIESIRNSKKQTSQSFLRLNKELQRYKDLRQKQDNDLKKALDNSNWGVVFSFLEKDFEDTLKQEPKIFEKLILAVSDKNDFYIKHIFDTNWNKIVGYYNKNSWDINQLLNIALRYSNEEFCSFFLFKEKDFSLELKNETEETKDGKVFNKINNTYSLLESAISNKSLSSQYIIELWDSYFEVDFNKKNTLTLEIFKRKDELLIKKLLNTALDKNVKPYVLFDSETMENLINKKIDFIKSMQSYQKNFIIKLEKKVLENSNSLNDNDTRTRKVL